MSVSHTTTVRRRAATLGLAALFAVTATIGTAACGSTAGKTDTGGAGAAPTGIASAPGTAGPAKASSSSSSPALEGKAYGHAPRAWATRTPSTIGVHGLDVHGQSFTVGGQAKIVVYRDGSRGIPSHYKETTARYTPGRHGGGFDLRLGLLDCTAYGYGYDSTLMVLDATTDTWSNKVRVSTGCNRR
ncbi:hypothetical protein [Streptomyces sp. NPDC018693]|uniref:hypothetical protein n=1 Tax=unclassified Streptomyces TaxID=2593676 RepID=UPI00378E0731